jgi:hypothetical protein
VVGLRGVTSPRATEAFIVLQTTRMLKLAHEGDATNDINKKIEQLGEEQLHLMNNIQITTNTLDGYTKQLRAMSD